MRRVFWWDLMGKAMGVDGFADEGALDAMVAGWLSFPGASPIQADIVGSVGRGQPVPGGYEFCRAVSHVLYDTMRTKP
jgi:hypothetical protein